MSKVIENVIDEAEAALGENLVWITDKLDLQVRQKDAETLRKLEQLNKAWQSLCQAQHMIKKGIITCN